MIFFGRELIDEEYSCSCGDYRGHNGDWRCLNCGRRVIVEGDTGTKRVACYRIPEDELEVGMRLLLEDHFYEILALHAPIERRGREVQYMNLRGFGSYSTSTDHYVLVAYQ